jgi:hypothetical protein
MIGKPMHSRTYAGSCRYYGGKPALRYGQPFLPPQLDTTNAGAHRDTQSATAMALAIAVVLNRIFEAFSPTGFEWSEELSGFIKKMIGIAEEASRFRSFEAGFMVGSVFVASTATAEPKLKIQP